MLIESRITEDVCGELLTLVYRLTLQQAYPKANEPGYFDQKNAEDLADREVELVRDHIIHDSKDGDVCTVLRMYRARGWRQRAKPPFNPILEHEPRFFHDPDVPRWECRKCKCYADSRMAINPCGDPWGRTLFKVAGVRDGRHVWEIWYRGVLLRVVEADVC